MAPTTGVPPAAIRAPRPANFNPAINPPLTAVPSYALPPQNLPQAIPLYAMLPPLSEHCILSGWTCTYGRISTVGFPTYLGHLGLYMARTPGGAAPPALARPPDTSRAAAACFSCRPALLTSTTIPLRGNAPQFSVEFGVYWQHRKMHTVKWCYKHMHSIHHIYNKARATCAASSSSSSLRPPALPPPHRLRRR